jgi:hypothetical protein
MTVGKAIYYLLTNSTDVTDIVSTRVYPEIAEQNAALPYVVYNIANNEPTDTKPEPSKLDTAQIEVNVYSESYTECIDLSVAVRAALDRVKGTYNGVNVQSIQYLNEIIDFDEPQRAYNIASDYDVRISRSGFEIAQGSPITGVELGELSDVNVTGVTDNQVLSYDAATDTWVPAIDAGGASELSDLSDVNTSLPSDGEVLIYSGGEFVNDNIAISNVTGLQAALDAAPDNLRELTDVTISTPADGDYLQYDSVSGEWQNSSLIIGRNGEQYTGNYDSEAETLLDGATATVELYYTAQADGDGLHEDAQSDTPTSGYDIQRKLYYAEKAQADPDTSGDWTQFTAIADNTTFANAKAALLAYLKERTGGTVPISLKMTWEEVAQAPSFTGLLNESYGSGAEAAYSTRRLNGNVTDCMVIRRASDSTTTTIGFVDGDIDESAIETFCTGTTCTVYQWVDQSGNGNTATAAASGNEPTIYTGGALVKEGGKVALDFDGSNDILALSSVLIHGTTGRTIFSVIQADQQRNDGIVALQTGSASAGGNYNLTSEPVLRVSGGNQSWSGADLSSQTLMSLTLPDNSGVDDANLYLTGTLASQVSTTTTTINTVNTGATQIGAFGSTTFDGNIQEVILYDSDKSSDRTSIEENIGDYFTQNTPLLDTYSGAAACYSLRLMRSAYTGALINVWNGTSYADIYPNVFGELDTVALAAHCGSNDGFIRYWYDQSGNTNTATQTVTGSMPKIYDGTTGVNTLNGKPATVQAANAFVTSPTISFNSAVSLSFVCSLTSNSFILSGQSTGQEMLIAQNGSTSTQIDSQVGTPAYYLNGTSKTFTDRADVYSSFNAQKLLYANADFSAWTKINFGYAFSPSGFPMANMQEFVIWNSDQSSNRTNIEDNINTFYSIY